MAEALLIDHSFMGWGDYEYGLTKCQDGLSTRR